tara:strand:- start:227 stop:748 length:522 start_codon:yes stop_codon:yes gene_type:complete
MKLLDIAALLLFITTVASVVLVLVTSAEIISDGSSKKSKSQFTSSNSESFQNTDNSDKLYSIFSGMGNTLFYILTICIGHLLCTFTKWDSTTSCIIAILIGLSVLGTGISIVVPAIMVLAEIHNYINYFPDDSLRKKYEILTYVIVSTVLSVGLCAVFYSYLLIASRIKKLRK